MPALRWRTWRYGIGEREVDLQRGWWTRTRTLVPMARIQHVDTARGPLQRRFGLASVVLYTAAGANEIPALDEATAAAARERIASLANVREDL
jgi:membrane protein YdbS with pleckstrin-like domain